MVKTKKIFQPDKRMDKAEKEESRTHTDKSSLIAQFIQENIINLETLNLTLEDIKKLYEKAYQFYLAGKYKEAKALFATLLAFGQADFNFIYGFATCCFMLKEYELAAESYLQSSLVEPSNPLPYFYAADCYLQQADLESARLALGMVIQRSVKIEYQEIKNRAQLTLDALTANYMAGK